MLDDIFVDGDGVVWKTRRRSKLLRVAISASAQSAERFPTHGGIIKTVLSFLNVRSSIKSISRLLHSLSNIQGLSIVHSDR